MTAGPTSSPHAPALPEGEEQPPPGVRSMAVVRWGLVVLMALAATGAWVQHAVSARSAGQAAGQRYVCPMHPQIVTDHKGECPICGMDLVPASGAPTPAAAAPVAGAAVQVARPGGPAEYTCPMHPDFVTTDPSARCPECHMKLVPRAPAAAPAPTPAAAPASLPGLAPLELTADRIQLIGMRTATASRGALGNTLRGVAYVAANESALVSVSARFSGWVETLAVAQTGQLVQKGEVLASIYSPDMQNAQQVFLNALKWADRRPQQAGTPAGSAPVSDLERDARNRLEVLGVAGEDIETIASTGQPLRNVNIRAPVRGYVARKSILRGLFVSAGTEMFQIADLSSVWVLVDVPETDIPRVQAGQHASFEVRAWPGERFGGVVQLVYPALNAGSRTLQARIELRNPALKLRPGMFGEVTLELGASQAVVVPSEAVIDTGELQYVFVDRGGGRFEPRAVRPGRSGGGKVAILEGLAEGEVVVTTANFLLDSESRLRAAMEGFSSAEPSQQGHRDHAAMGGPATAAMGGATSGR